MLLPFLSTTSDRGASSLLPEFDLGGKFKSGSAAAVAALSGEPAPNPEEEDRPGLLLLLEDEAAAPVAVVGAEGGGAEETLLMAEEGLSCWALRSNEGENVESAQCDLQRGK